VGRFWLRKGMPWLFATWVTPKQTLGKLKAVSITTELACQSDVFGERLPKCGTEQASRELAAQLSAELREVLEPLLNDIESLNERIKEYDARMARHKTSSILAPHSPGRFVPLPIPHVPGSRSDEFVLSRCELKGSV
jgi:hypothetical protein